MARSLGITSLQILDAVRGGACYGLELVRRTGLPSGTVYPAVSRLKKRGLVTGRWEDQRVAEREGRPRRKYYALTPEGEVALEAGAARYRGVLDRMDVGIEGG